MEKLQKYLTQIEKRLKSLPEPERKDIIREIESEIMELKAQGNPETEILERLGTPQELAAEDHA